MPDIKPDLKAALESLFSYQNMELSTDPQDWGSVLQYALLALIAEKTGQISVDNIQIDPPVGGATEAKQDDQLDRLNLLAEQATLAELLGRLPSTLSSDRLKVDVGTLDIPAPTGGATEAKQDEQILIEESIDGKIPALISGRLPVNVSFPTTQAVSLATAPLPTDAATDTKLQELLTRLNLLASETTLDALADDIANGISVAVSNFPTDASTNTKLQELLTRLNLLSEQATLSQVNTAVSNLNTNGIKNLLGTASAPATISINSTTPTLLFAANTNRISALFANTTGVNIYVGSTTGLSAANGILITNGEKFEDSASSSAWYVIAASGGPYSIPVLEISA